MAHLTETEVSIISSLLAKIEQGLYCLSRKYDCEIRLDPEKSFNKVYPAAAYELDPMMRSLSNEPAVLLSLIDEMYETT
ncbi:hypothetical protein NMY22_g20153 [Coprinellus aureogranulatus]|nr:hypothetical protein NMY22_g20153 [Coprinellus aureogranulatus]